MFYINKGPAKKNGTTTVMGRISVSNEMVQFSTQMDVDPALWDAKRYRLKGRERESIEINNKLQKLTNAITGYHKDFIKQQEYVTAGLLKTEFVISDRKTICCMNSFVNITSNTNRWLGLIERKTPHFQTAEDGHRMLYPSVGYSSENH